MTKMLKANIVLTGLSFLGTPYEFNAKPFQTKTFDCSSFTQYVYGINGINLPRNSRQQFQMGTSIPFEQIEMGDLIFFTTKKRKHKQGIERIGHVAIYIGNEKILHAHPLGKRVIVSRFTDYWKKYLVGVKRMV